jgi:CxxC-x17-CxxC domain-containing protein
MSSVFSDRILPCQDCSAQFLFSIGEQEFFSAKGLKNEPKRCPNCRLVARMGRAGLDSSQASTVPCAECGSPAKIPFQPKGHKPVYCTGCFHARKRTDNDGIGEEVKEPANAGENEA